MRQSFEWKAYEYVYREKTGDWFWALGIIAVSVAVTAVLFNNLLFAVFILLGSFTLALYANRKPKIIDFSIDGKGVRIGKKIYLYGALDAFWMEDGLPEYRIILRSKKVTMPYITVPIETDNAEEIRAFLLQQLPEEEMAEPLIQQIMEYLGF